MDYYYNVFRFLFVSRSISHSVFYVLAFKDKLPTTIMCFAFY